MALSDSCFGRLEAFGRVARGLADDVHWCSAPDNPLRYGEEIDALRRTRAAVAEAPYDAEAGGRLLRLATLVMRHLDTPPDAPEAAKRTAEMMARVSLLRCSLDAEDASGLPSTVEHIARETPFTERAAKRLAALLPKLGRTAYDAAIKIITNIGSATARKILGL